MYKTFKNTYNIPRVLLKSFKNETKNQKCIIIKYRLSDKCFKYKNVRTKKTKNNKTLVLRVL